MLWRRSVPGVWVWGVPDLLYFLFITSLLWFIYKCDPFDLSTLSLEYSRTLYQQWTAPAQERNANDRISVVMLVEDDLPQWNQTWPVQYGFHARVLDTLLRMKPKAVMVDFAFLDRREQDETLDSLKDMVTLYRERGVPLYFAGLPPEEGGSDPAAHRQAVSRDRHGVISELSDQGPDRIVFVPGDTPDAAVQYPLLSAGDDSNGPPYLSAALAMFRGEHGITGNSVSFWREPMYVKWGLYPGGGSNGLYRCRTLPDGLLSRMDVTFTNTLNPFRESPAKPYVGPNDPNPMDPLADLPAPWLRDTCPPHRSLSVSHLLHAASGNLPPAETCWVQSALHKKLVFYGANLNMGQDVVQPPTHRSIPGVYLHAMALENLLERRAGYQREGKALLWGQGAAGPTEMLVFFMLMVLSERLNYLLRGICRSDALAVEGAPECPDDVPAKGQEKGQATDRCGTACESIGALTLWIVLELCFMALGILIVILAVVMLAMLAYPAPDFIGMLSLVGLRNLPTAFRFWSRLKGLGPVPGGSRRQTISSDQYKEDAS